MRKLVLFCGLLWASIQLVHAQDPVFSQYFLMPETLNPGFTGAIATTKAGVIHRTQWPTLDFNINTQYAYVDTWVPKFKSGFGISAINHVEAINNYQYSQFDFNYVIVFQLSNKWYFRPSLTFGMGLKDLGFSNIVFGDQLGFGGPGGGSIDPVSLERQKLFFNANASLLLHNQENWIGLTIRHINKPNISITSIGQDRLDMFFSVHGAVKLPFEYFERWRYRKGDGVFLLGNFMFQSQYNRFDLGMEYKFRNFLAGVLAESNPIRIDENANYVNVLNFFGGFKWNGFKFGYSYGLNTSKLNKNGGVYEFSVAYSFENKRQKMSCYF